MLKYTPNGKIWQAKSKVGFVNLEYWTNAHGVRVLQLQIPFLIILLCHVGFLVGCFECESRKGHLYLLFLCFFFAALCLAQAAFKWVF